MLLKLYEKNNNPQDLQQVVDILNDGGLIIYPTDTMYAIGCHGLKERAIERICRIKNIDPRKNNLSIICYDLSSISEYAKVDNNTFKLMKRNLPGPFTFILNGTNKLPKIFRNRKEVGIRMPDNHIIREIARLLDAPIMTTTLPHEADEDLEYMTDPELTIIVSSITSPPVFLSFTRPVCQRPLVFVAIIRQDFCLVRKNRSTFFYTAQPFLL